jgi:hypothetical protein
LRLPRALSHAAVRSDRGEFLGHAGGKTKTRDPHAGTILSTQDGKIDLALGPSTNLAASGPLVERSRAAILTPHRAGPWSSAGSVTTMKATPKSPMRQEAMRVAKEAAGSSWSTLTLDEKCALISHNESPPPAAQPKVRSTTAPPALAVRSSCMRASHATKPLSHTPFYLSYPLL